jgi:hypothetical protein
MCSQSYPVAVVLQLVGECDEGLDITATSNHLDQDVEADYIAGVFLVCRWLSRSCVEVFEVG